jgi:hypothetical protein
MTITNRILKKHPEVAGVLDGLLSRVRKILNHQFVGLYLYGSLATGDFNPYQSDIDFVVATEGDLPRDMVEALEAMHGELAAGPSSWAKKLEGVYMPLYALPRYDPGYPPFPTINEGRFYLGRQGSDWIFQRFVLREHPAVIAGPALVDLIDPVTPDDLRAAVRGVFREWWEPNIGNPDFFSNPDYQPFAVLSMCRALFTLRHGKLIPKPKAAAWALENLDPRWRELVEGAMAWQRGDPAGDIGRTIDLVKYTAGLARKR